MKKDVSGGNYHPFWEGFPLTDIHLCIAPDVLHQLYQGVLKYLVVWVQHIVGQDELDDRIRKLPPSPGVRHFAKGISNLAQVSGSERKHIARILLSCIIGKVDTRGITACRSVLHFIQLAQYPSHDEDTLNYMQQELNTWHKYRDYFITEGSRQHFNIPKFHSLLHYIDSIRWIGTTDNSNTEAFERLHIDFAKEGWRASNKRDHFPQMVTFISRQEKVTSVAKNPSEPRKKIAAITLLHGAPGFEGALKLFLNDYLPKSEQRKKQSALEGIIPFLTLEVWHNFGLVPSKVLDEPEKARIKARPRSSKLSARFDTVLVLEKDEAESTAVRGEVAARLRVIFQLPSEVYNNGRPSKAPPNWPKEHLAYITWYTRFKSSPDSSTGMYKVEPAFDSNGMPQGAIIPLSNIRQSCMLVPSTKTSWDKNWNSDNILDECSSFFVNNLQTKYTYQTIY
ncbi:hypothetical protein F5878DRAFT_544828 [Lentinula raphanica]|uniref:Uncharacterized protein n=1 Tax=Lentinula raphanica TaxID=153919 RepID=A0AA38P1D2_9AGAR|nr:hypothetical protein F5878DRAFT_544828 [Lentinula raphanica]